MADSKEASYAVWWNHAEGEDTMEAEHLPGWEQTIGMIKERTLTGMNVLDFGCNRGGFLRLLHERKPYASAVGIDLGADSVAIANERKGDLPVRYEVSGAPEQLGEKFDIAFCLSVIYLIDDLPGHAARIHQALKPGGVYYATYTDMASNPSGAYFKEAIEQYSHLTANLHTLDALENAFRQQGFRVELQRRVPSGFVEIHANDVQFKSMADLLQAQYENAYLFRFTKSTD